MGLWGTLPRMRSQEPKLVWRGSGAVPQAVQCDGRPTESVPGQSQMKQPEKEDTKKEPDERL